MSRLDAASVSRARLHLEICVAIIHFRLSILVDAQGLLQYFAGVTLYSGLMLTLRFLLSNARGQTRCLSGAQCQFVGCWGFFLNVCTNSKPVMMICLLPGIHSSCRPHARTFCIVARGSVTASLLLTCTCIDKGPTVSIKEIESKGQNACG